MHATWFSPALLACTFIALFGAIIWLVHARQYEQQREGLESDLVVSRANVRLRLERDRDMLERMALTLSQNPGNEEALAHEVQGHLPRHAHLLGAILYDANARPVWHVPENLKAHIRASRQLRATPEWVFLKQGDLAFHTTPLRMVDADLTYQILVPVWRDNAFAGALVGVYRSSQMLAQVIHPKVTQRYRVRLISAGGGIVDELKATSRVEPTLVRRASLGLSNPGLTLELARSSDRAWGRDIKLLLAACVALTLGMAWGMWGLKRDIAGRRRAEASVRQSEERYREIVEGTSNVIVQIDAQGRLRYANRAATNLLGFCAQNSTGKLALQFVCPRDQRRTAAAFANWVRHRVRRVTFEHRLIGIDGQHRDILWTLRLHYHHDGGLMLVTGIGRDITRHKQHEQEREELIAELRRALAKVSTLSGLLPICSGCKAIRDDQGYWNRIEVYIREHSMADFSHSLCPDCAHELYPEIYPRLRQSKEHEES